MKQVHLLLFCLALELGTRSFAQTTDSTAVDDEEDYDQYGEVEYADGTAPKPTPMPALWAQLHNVLCR